MRLKWYLMSLTFAAALSLSACIKQSSKKEPVTVSIWHVYGGQVSSPLNDIIDEFNSTVGREKGIYVQVTSVSNTNSIHEAVLAASNNELGASELPNMFVSYPKTVVALKDSNILVDYRDYFSEEKLSEFVPEFIEEGMIDGKLNILPLAKSTEIMFINKDEDARLFIDEDYVNIVPQDLLERGIRLREEYGIYDIAWRFDDVMEVLKIAKSKDMVIVGGEVYRLSGNEPIITYDSWSIKDGDDGDDAFELAVRYITNYRARNGDDFAYCPTICPYTILQEPNEQTEK